MSFKKNKFIIVKNTISEDLSYFCFQYFLLKRQVANTLFKSNIISPPINYFGTWEDIQVPGTYSHYADIVMETLLLKIHSLVEKKTKLKLVPNYSYARIYKKGDILKRHIDRFSCEISTTLNLGGDPWPIYLNHNNKNIKVNLKPGDMLIYKGSEIEHWRESFTGENCTQVFLHYNNKKTKGAKKNMYDGRPHLGLPSWFKKING